MGAMAAPLRDPGIVAVFDAAEADTGPFLVMEFVDGASLADSMRGERLTVDRTAEIGAAVATALGAAHRAGTVHGSLTPRDVLVARDGTVKVTDFGSAGAGLAGITESPVEAAIYGSPERLQGAPADASGDLYALGVLLHEAVTGAPPFGGADAVTITRDKLDRTPLPPSATVASVPPAFDAIVERLISPNVARRYHTAEEAAADLERLRAPVARDRGAPDRGRRRPRWSPGELVPEKKSNAGWIAALVILAARDRRARHLARGARRRQQGEGRGARGRRPTRAAGAADARGGRLPCVDREPGQPHDRGGGRVRAVAPGRLAGQEGLRGQAQREHRAAADVDHHHQLHDVDDDDLHDDDLHDDATTGHGPVDLTPGGHPTTRGA